MPIRNRPEARTRWLTTWLPEDPGFWETRGRVVARRNLVFSVLSEHVGFSVWSMFSVLALFMGPEYHIDPAGRFTLVAVASLVGAVLRVPYGFAVARFGGRNWTVFSSAALLVPTVTLLVIMTPGTPYPVFMAVAVLTGVGGANFASSMTNVNAFFPQRLKGWALGVNAGGGNVGVAVVQLVALVVIATAGAGRPRVLIAVYLPLIVAATLCSLRSMDNLTPVRNDTGAAVEAARHPHTWIMSFLYVGTFGSFIGYSFAFGLVLTGQFHRTPLQAAALTFLGPLLGSLIRPVGGLLADRLGGARVTLGTFAAMTAAAALVVLASLRSSLPLFVAGFVILFILTGVGNGSTYKMIPGIFRAEAWTLHDDRTAREIHTRRLSGAAMALVGAVGALGGLGINLALRRSFLTSGDGTAAFAAFLVYYAVCCVVTWAVYVRRPDGGQRAQDGAVQAAQRSFAEV